MNAILDAPVQASLLVLDNTASGEAEDFAKSRISAGDISDSASWSGPSADAQNTYIEENGWEAYGKWFLGRDSESPADTKARYKFPFSQDFKNVDMAGLRAIRSRAAQYDDTTIFDAAGRLLDAAKEKSGVEEAASEDCNNRITFQMRMKKSDRHQGVMSDVVILEFGEARGHRMMVSEKTLSTSLSLLGGETLPAYLTHTDAFQDRLLSEIGSFSEFYLDTDKDKGMRLKARKFEILPSFKRDEPERYDRLFDLAERMPQTFGISIVFEAELFWETPDGVLEFTGFGDKPEDTKYEYPTVNPKRITSADFVDTPAATSSLFSEENTNRDKLTNSRDMNTPVEEHTEMLFDESASAELERRKAEAGELEESASAPEPAPAPEAKSKSKSRKKKLEEPQDATDGDETAPTTEESEITEDSPEAAEEEPAATEELEEKLAAANAEILELQKQVEVLKKVFGGTDAIEDDLALEASAPESKEDAINKYLELNPTHNRMTAVLEVAKKKPELFNQN